MQVGNDSTPKGRKKRFHIDSSVLGEHRDPTESLHGRHMFRTSRIPQRSDRSGRLQRSVSPRVNLSESQHKTPDPLEGLVEVLHTGRIRDADVLGRAEAFSCNRRNVCFMQQAMSNVSGRAKAAFAE